MRDRLDGRSFANLAALREAQAKIEESLPVPTAEDLTKAERERRAQEQARKRRPTPEEAARAWKARNREYRNRRSLTVETPGDALMIARQSARSGAGGILKPRPLGRRASRVGESIEAQVASKVAHTRALLLPGESLEDAVQAWPLPMTFYDPVPPLCGVEAELLASHDREESDEETQEAARKPKSADDARLMGGMRRADP